MNRMIAGLVAVALPAIAVGGCTTMGTGTGQSGDQKVTGTFGWTETGASRGTMVANLSNGEVFQGPFFQVTQESRIDDYGPLWNGWGSSWNWHQPWSGWGLGWSGWGPWGPSNETITHYTGQVLANLQGSEGFMRCNFTLATPSSGMAGGGLGKCQLPNGNIIDTQFPRQ
jgi:hypothetical protein